MKINFELTLKDMDNFYKETFFMKRLFLKFLKENLISNLIESVIVVSIIIFLFNLWNINFNIIFCILCFMAFVVFGYIILGLTVYYSAGKKNYKMTKGKDKNYEVNIDDNERIKITSRDSETIYYWSKIKAIENTKSNILIFVSERLAFIIPKRIFESEQKLNEFWNEVQNKYKSVTKE